MTLLNKHVAAIAARMMTWEVTTAFDGTLTEKELRKRFDDEFRDVRTDKMAEIRGSCDFRCGEDCGELLSNRVFFWPLVSFNATDGRKHRFLVSVADEPLIDYRKKFDRCLPRQVALYAVADKILRGEWENCEAVCHDDCNENRFETRLGSFACADNVFEYSPIVENGNLLLVALWNKVLYVLVFVNGRLCHWSEDFGYGDSFDERCRVRVERFKSFLKSDDLFANTGALDVGFSNVFNEVYMCCDCLADMDELFRVGVRDPFWQHLDLDKCESMKPCEKRRWTLCVASLLALCTALTLMCGNSWIWNRSLEWWRSWNGEGLAHGISSIAPVELSLPAVRDLELLAWAKGHGDWTIAKRNVNRGESLEGSVGAVEESSEQRRKFLQNSRCGCDASAITLLGIVGGRAALVATADGEMKTLSLGDSLYSYRVKRIGMDDIVLRCGGKEVRYEIGSKKISKISSR